MAVYTLYKPESFRMIEEKELDYINSKDDLSEKIFALMQINRLTDEDIAEREFLHSKLTRFLQPYYPDCVILPFGSTINGFGFKGCDLDLLFLPFPEYCNLDFKDCDDVTIPVPFQVIQNQFLREKLLSMNETCHLKFIKRIFYSKRYFFKKIVFIPAKCPILNLKFVESNITCDFSASNRLVLCNTELQSLYGNLDDRVKPLVMFLRYWAKALGFIQKSLLSSYSLSFLVIFYLQNTEPPILPSVNSLTELAGYSDIIDGWETAICKNICHIPRNKNPASIEQLLMGFFDFYWYFNFVQNIVSPHTGKAIPINEILESQDERIKTFQVSTFSIQDPFILSRNISRNASIKSLFKLALLTAKRLLLEGVSFEKLFDISVYQSEIDKLFEPVLQNYNPCLISSTVSLSYEICCKLDITKGFHLWYEKVCDTVLEVLQYGLLFECEVIDKARRKKLLTPPFKKRKFDMKCGNLELLMSIQCAVYEDTCHSRKKISLNEIEPELKEDEEWSPCLLKEHNLSRKLIQSYNTSNSPLAWILCNCYKYSSEQIPDVFLIFSPISDVHIFSSMSTFLKSYVQKQVVKILSEKQ